MDYKLQRSAKWLQLLASYPYLLLLILSVPLGAELLKHGYFNPILLSDASFIEKLFEFMLQTMMNMWLFSFPVWLISILFIMTQSENLNGSQIVKIILGFIGQTLLFLISYTQYIKWI